MFHDFHNVLFKVFFVTLAKLMPRLGEEVQKKAYETISTDFFGSNSIFDF